MGKSISSSDACRLARVNKQRFNEAVARGDYPCAPPVYGRARVFAARDVFGLWLYGHLTDEGIPPARAGELACELVEVMRHYPDLQEVLLVRMASGGRKVIANTDGGVGVVGCEILHLKAVRDAVGAL